MSDPSKYNEDRQLDLSIGVVKKLLLDAYDRYNEGMRDNAHYVASYWDGYIRALQHVIEADGQ